MGRKVLFFMGIVLAHGALAAGFVSREDSEEPRALPSTCVQDPASEPLDLAPPRELLAYVVPPREDVPEVAHP
jgi:hypothetical protein